MTPEEQEQKDADLFLRTCLLHISNATDTQRRILKRALMERPDDLSAVEQAVASWQALDEKELMRLISELQKQFDRDTWEFMSRWRA